MICMIQMRSLGLLICKVLACIGVCVLPFVCLFAFYERLPLLWGYASLGCLIIFFVLFLAVYEI